MKICKKNVENCKIEKKGYKNMLRLHWIEIFLRTIPEMLLIIWGIYVIARKPINIKIIVLSSIVMGLITFYVRTLPIRFGLHTFIIVILTICAMVIIGVSIIKAIYGTLTMVIILYLSEFLNIAMLNLLNININIVLLNPVIKCVLLIPSLIILCLSIITIRYFIKRKTD